MRRSRSRSPERGGGGGGAALLLENLVPLGALRAEEERRFLGEDVEAEAREHGKVLETAVPEPPPGAEASGRESARAYVLFRTQGCRAAAQRALHGRTFDGNRVAALPVSAEHWAEARAGGWPRVGGGGAGGGAPGGACQGGPWAGGAGPPGGAPTGGLVRMRGLPFSASKPDILFFFQDCGQLLEEDVSLVLGPDGRPSGEAYVSFAPGRADARMGMLKNRQSMPGSSRYVELFFAAPDEPRRREAQGCAFV